MTATTGTTYDINDACAYIETLDTAGIQTLTAALQSRTRVIFEERKRAVRFGATIRIQDASPRYLDGLTGTVTNIQGVNVSVTLDEPSTRRLAVDGWKKYRIAPEEKEFPIHVHASSCEVI